MYKRAKTTKLPEMFAQSKTAGKIRPLLGDT